MPDTPFPQVRQLVTQATIDRYAELSGDYNPLHVDPEQAARSEFGGTIAHGPVALQPYFVAMTSWLGREALPPGSRVSVRFRQPVRPGDAIECRQVESEDGEGLRTDCVNQDGVAVVLVTTRLPS